MGSNGVGTAWRAPVRRDLDVAIQEVNMPRGGLGSEAMDSERPWVIMEFLAARSPHEIVATTTRSPSPWLPISGCMSSAPSRPRTGWGSCTAT